MDLDRSLDERELVFVHLGKTTAAVAPSLRARLRDLVAAL